jgi:hypothetical protein
MQMPIPKIKIKKRIKINKNQKEIRNTNEGNKYTRLCMYKFIMMEILFKMWHLMSFKFKN